MGRSPALPDPDTLTIYLRDINGRRSAEEERDRLVATVRATLARAEQLQAIMTALGEAMTLDRVVEVVLEQTRELFGTLFVGLMVFGDDGHSVRLVRLDQLPTDSGRALGGGGPGRFLTARRRHRRAAAVVPWFPTSPH